MGGPDEEAAECVIAKHAGALTNDDYANYNMKRALMPFDNLIIRPNETVSFFDIAGFCGKADGCKVSAVIGGFDYDGGICRTASVLYDAAIRVSLTRAGLKDESIFDCGVCTYERPDLFSWRRAKNPNTHILSFIALRG